jgi:hypothetical protein
MAGGGGVTLGFLKFVLGLDGLAFEEGLGAAEKQLKASQKKLAKIGERMTSVGQSLSLSITAPFSALVASSIPAARESAQAMGQVEAALASMGEASGRTKAQLADAATGLMRLSTFDDDEILRKVTANLLTFGNVAGAQFDRAQLAAVNLATRLNTDLQSATLMVGKALNDPVKGIKALTRAGIQFTDAQKAQIVAMSAAGDAAGAQSIILGELERQFGGSAKAMRDATPGADLKNAWDDFQETVGKLALNVLPPLTKALASLLDKFNGLSPRAQEIALAVAGVAAAAGPLLVTFGSITSGVGSLLPLLVKLRGPAGLLGLTGAAGPLALVAAGAVAVYVAYQKWDQIGPWIDGVIKRTAEAGREVNEVLANIQREATAFDKQMGIPAPTEFFSGIGRELQTGFERLERYGRAVDEWAKNFDAGAVRVWRSFETMHTRVQAAFDRMVGGIRDRINGSLRQSLQWVQDKAKAVGDAFYTLYDRVVGHSYVPDMVDGIGYHIARLPGLMVHPAMAALGQVDAGFQQASDTVGGAVEETATRTKAAWTDIARSAIDGVQGVVSAIRGGGLLDILGSLLDAFIQLGSTGLFGKTIKTNLGKSSGSFGGFRAAGGPTVPGKSYVVGENGPEWFTPRARGFVTPGGSGGRAGGPVTFDLRGAVMTADLLEQMNGIAVATGGQLIAGNEANRMKRARQSLRR